MRVLLLTFLLAASASAQTPQTGSISGTVTGAGSGEPLIGTNVFLVDTQLGAAVGVDGRYLVADVPAGSYTVRVSFIGYTSVDVPLTVVAGETTALDVALEISGDLTICFACVPPPPLFARGPFVARVVTYERVTGTCYAVEPGDTFTRDG